MNKRAHSFQFGTQSLAGKKSTTTAMTTRFRRKNKNDAVKTHFLHIEGTGQRIVVVSLFETIVLGEELQP